MDIADIKKKSYNFPVGTRVRVIVNFEDFNFFKKETGIVIRNSHDYLGVIVAFDNPRVFEDDSIQYKFNFNPDGLEIIEESTKKLIEKALSMRKIIEPTGCDHWHDIKYCYICKKPDKCEACGK